MQRRDTIGASLPKIPSSVLQELRSSNVRRTRSEVIRSSDSTRSPKMIFTSKHIKTSFNKGSINGSPRRVISKTFSDGQSSVASTSSNNVSEKGEDSFSSMSIPEIPVSTANPTPIPTETTPIPAESSFTSSEATSVPIHTTRSEIPSISEPSSHQPVSLTTSSNSVKSTSTHSIHSSHSDVSNGLPDDFAERVLSRTLTEVTSTKTITETRSETKTIEMNGYSNDTETTTSESLLSKNLELVTPPSTPRTNEDSDNDEPTSYHLTSIADHLHSLPSQSPSPSDRKAPVLHFPAPPDTPPPESPPPQVVRSEQYQREWELSTSDVFQQTQEPPSYQPPSPPRDLPDTTRQEAFQPTKESDPPPPPPQSSLPDPTPPPSPEPPLRTSSRNDNHVLSLAIKRSHDQSDDIPLNDADSPPVKKLSESESYQTSVATPAPPPPPPPPPPAPPTIIVPETERGRASSVCGSDISGRSEDEILKYFNRTVIGENTISSDSSSQIGEAPGLSLPKDDYFVEHGIDSQEQSKGGNSLHPTDKQKVIKWNERIKTTRAAIKPGTVDELKLVYTKLGEDNFKPSVIKRRRKEGLKLTRAQQMKRYKKVMDMFSEEELSERVPQSPPQTDLKSVEIIEKSGTEAQEVGSDMEDDRSSSGSDQETAGSYALNYDVTDRDSDRWDSVNNDEKNPYSRANITAFLNKRLANIQKNQKKMYEAQKKKDEEEEKTGVSDSNEFERKADDPVSDSTDFNSTTEQRDSYFRTSADADVIDSKSVTRREEQAYSESTEGNIPGHVAPGTELAEQAVSSASYIQTESVSKQDGEASLSAAYGIKEDGDKVEEKTDTGFRSSFFDDDTSAPVNTGNSEEDERASVKSEVNSEPNAMFSNGYMNTSSDNTAMSAAVGDLHSFDIHRRVSGVSRSTSGASAPREVTEESRNGVYVVQDNVGDLYVVEDISNTTRQTASLDQNGRIVQVHDGDTSHTMDTTQSSIRSFDFNGPGSSKISVDSSDINYGKAKEVISTLFDNMNSSDRGLAVTNFQNDSVERSNVTFNETSVTSDRGFDNAGSQAENHRAVSMNSDTDMALHEDVYKKTILNIVTDQQDRPLWSEQTTDTQVKAWMEDGERGDENDNYKTSIKLISGGQDMITPAPDYPRTDTDDRHVSRYNVSLADSEAGNTSVTNSLRSETHEPAIPEDEVNDVAQGVTVTTTKSTVIGQKVDMFVDDPQVTNVHMARDNNQLNGQSYRSRYVTKYDHNGMLNGYNSDSSLSDDERRHSKSYKVRQIKSSSLDRADSSRGGGKRYITRIESIPKGNLPNIQKTYFTSSDSMTTKVDNTISTYGDADSQYGSQTSRGTSGEGSPLGDESPRYRIVRAEMSPTTNHPPPIKHSIYQQEKPQTSNFYEYKTFTSEESVNKDHDIWRSSSRFTPDTSGSNSVVFSAHDSRSDRDSPSRYRVSKTISAEELFTPEQKTFTRSPDSYRPQSDQKLYKSVKRLEFETENQSPVRKRRHGRPDSDSEDEHKTMYRVSNVKKDQQFVRRHSPGHVSEPEEDSSHMYKVVNVTPSNNSNRAERRAASRSVFGSDSKEPVFSDEDNSPAALTNYRVGKTRSTEDLIVTRQISTKAENRNSKYRSSDQPIRFDSGYFDETIARKENSPSHTTVIRLDPGQKRPRSVESPSTLYKVVNVRHNDSRPNDKMWNTSPTRTRPDSDSEESDDGRKGKYRVSTARYPVSTTEYEYPASPPAERVSRREQSKYYVQRTFSPGRVEDSDPVSLKKIRSKSPQSYYDRITSTPSWHKSSDDLSRNSTHDYDIQQRSTSYTNLNPRYESPKYESKSYVTFNGNTRGSSIDRPDSQRYTDEKNYVLRATSPSPVKTGRYLNRSFSYDQAGDSGTGTEIASSDNEGNTDIYRQQSFKRVEQQIYTVRQEPLCSEIPDEGEDLKVERGKILIRNQIDGAKDEDDFDDNVNVFASEFHLQKDNPLYQSDQDLYKKGGEDEDEDEDRMSQQVTQDITFETVDRIAQKHSGGRQVELSPKPMRKQNLSALLLSKLANIDSKDIQQHIDVEHHNEEIYGDLDFIHADGTRSGSGNTDNFDAVNEKVNLLLKEGKAFVIIKVIAERVVPIDYEFNVWRKSSAIVTRQIEIDLLANEQRRRLYKHVMDKAGAHGAIEGGVFGPLSMTPSSIDKDNELSSMDTLKLFSQILSVAEGQGDNDETAYGTRQVQGRLSSSGSHDLLY